VSKSLRKRINDIENCILKPIEPGSTRLSVADLPEAEQKLFDRIYHIQQNFQLSDDFTPSGDERKLLNTGVNILARRSMDLFETCFTGLLCGDDPVARWMFRMRLYWFIRDITIMVNQFLDEQKIYDQKGKTWKQKEKECDETVYKTWNHDLFTRESFTKFYRELTEAKEKHV